MLISLLFAAVVTSLFSFSPIGGEGFEILLNNNVIMQRFGEKKMNEVQSIHLTLQQANQPVTVNYHHCGKVAKNRIIRLKNRQGKMVKEWRFADAATAVAAMTCQVKDILHANKGKEGTFNLFYTSSELPTGRLLSLVVVSQNTLAVNK